MALGRHLGLSYNTAWLPKSKIMEAMLDRMIERFAYVACRTSPLPPPLSG